LLRSGLALAVVAGAGVAVEEAGGMTATRDGDVVVGAVDVGVTRGWVVVVGGTAVEVVVVVDTLVVTDGGEVESTMVAAIGGGGASGVGAGTLSAFGYVPTRATFRSREAKAFATTAQRTAAKMSVAASRKCLRRFMVVS
jgi:hypothetical protein